MKKKKKLTNEELSKHFNNPFELVNHAIVLAKHLVGSGHELSDSVDRNAASIILKKVLKERESEEKNKEFLDLKERESTSSDKDFPDPMLQVI